MAPVGDSDVDFSTHSLIFGAGSTTLQPVEFTISSDSVANEANEIFRLRLQYDSSLFGPTDDLSANEVAVTIIDGDSKYRMQDYG